MNAESLLQMGLRGIHLLFDTEMIVRAFSQDADCLRGELEGRFGEVQSAIESLVNINDPEQARQLIQSLPDSVRHVLVLLYFELLDGPLRETAILH